MKMRRVTIAGQVRLLRFATAAALLELILDREMTLSRSEYEMLLDDLFDWVGEARNELYRFR